MEGRDTRSSIGKLDRSPYGINSHSQIRPMERLAGIGVHWYRIDIDWDTVEAAGEDRPEWAHVDAVVETAGRLSLSLLASVGYTPGWARIGADHASPPRENGHFVRFVRKFVRRYRGRIPCVSIWNEPDLPLFWTGTPDRFRSLYVEALTAAREENPEVVLCGPDLSGWSRKMEKKWLGPILDAAAAAQGGPLLDVITHHQYGGDDTVAGRVKEIEKLHEFLSRRAYSDRPLWITEIGWNSKVRGIGQVTAEEQAQRLRDVMMAMRERPWWAKTFWYDSHGKVNGTGPAEWGILEPDEPHREKPAFRAYGDVIASNVLSVDVPVPPPAPAMLSDAEARRRVAAGYRGILGRDPDFAGIRAHLPMVERGGTLEFCRALFASPEFKTTARGDQDLAVQLYSGILGREPDAGGLATTLDALARGQGPERAAAMIDGPEFGQAG